MNSNYLVDICEVPRRLCVCPGKWDPVCGTNEMTYVNDCHLRLAQCDDPTLKLKHRLECTGNVISTLLFLVFELLYFNYLHM